jgi:hypothetical protein
MMQILYSEVIIAQLLEEFPPPIKSEGPLSCSQKLATEPYPQSTTLLMFQVWTVSPVKEFTTFSL